MQAVDAAKTGPVAAGIAPAGLGTGRVRPAHSTAVREMPAEERPRERLERFGPEVLRDAELIAVLFRTGTREQGAVAVAEETLRQFGGLRELAQASITELLAVHGLGRIKAIELKAALELGKRLARFTAEERPCIRSAEDIAQLLMTQFKDLETEHFKSVLVNVRNEVLKVVDISSGALDAAACLPRDVFRRAVREGAHGVVICHNHPSGNPEPSASDIGVTERLVEAAEILGLRLLDHVVFGDGRYVSFRERGLL